MLILFVVSILVASMLALVAYLQVGSAWWGGLVVAGVLFVAGLAVTVVTRDVDGFPPALILSVSAILCAMIVIGGSVLALILQRRFGASKIAGYSFVGGTTLVFVTLMGLSIG